MKARNKIIGLAITTTTLAISLQTSAQINVGPNNTISGTHSSIAGGNWSSITGSNSVIAGGLSNIIGERFTAIGGGLYNYASGFATTIAGGEDNTAGGQWSFVGGGHGNTAGSGFSATVGGGSGNAATALYSTVGGGSANTASGQDSTIAGGVSNTASNLYATVSGGIFNTAGATAATVPGGRFAYASHYGQFAYANGRFAADGDAQTSMYVVHATTTDGTQTEMFLDASSLRLTLASGRTLVFEIQVAARSSSNTSAAYLIKGAIDNNSGTTSFLNAPIVEVLGEDVSAWDATVQADDTNDALVLKVTGAASTTVRWVATLRITEVGH